ncbi:MAG: flagellar motor switch protein FliN [Magnetospirillum sp.]|nr:flagellar motor switch protein FliN [Magnetospirillum sp.]
MNEDETQIGDKPHDAVYDVSVEVYAVLGTATLPIAQLLKLGRGAVVELDRKVNDPVDLFVNQRRIAKADVVVVEDHLAVTVSEVLKRVAD